MDNPGIYDDACTALRESTGAQCAIAIIIGGTKGTGFSVQTIFPEILNSLPELLRITADSIEQQHRILNHPAG